MDGPSSSQSPKRRRRRRRDSSVSDSSEEELYPVNEEDFLSQQITEAQKEQEKLGPVEDLNAPEAEKRDTERKFAAKDHVLITAGPAPGIQNPQTYHGGRVVAERYTLDPSSVCSKGAFVKPWLKVPKGGALRHKFRRSTDGIFCNILLALFGVVAVLSVVGFWYGNLNRLQTGGVDFLGKECGADVTLATPELLRGKTHSERKYLWYPITPSMNNVTEVLGLALCVSECPHWESDPKWKPLTEIQYAWDEKLRRVRAGDPRCFYDRNLGCLRKFSVDYPSLTYHNLCIPDVWARNDTAAMDENVLRLANDLVGALPLLNDFWFAFTSDIYGARYQLLISSFSSLLYGEMYLFLMRTSPIRVAWGSVILLITTSTIFFVDILFYVNDLESGNLNRRFDLRIRHSTQMRSLAWVVFIVGLVNFLLCIWVRKKVAIACELMNEVNKFLNESYGIALVAPGVWFALSLSFLSAFVFQLFTGTVGSLQTGDSLYSDIDFDLSQPFPLKNQIFVLSDFRGPMQAISVVVVLWGMGFVSVLGYSVAGFVSLLWYFSAVGEPKKPPTDSLAITSRSIGFHVGSYAIGAVVITFFESTRGLLEKIAEKVRMVLQKISDISKIAGYLTCLLEFVLLLFDRFLRLVRRDAMVIQIIEGKKFVKAATRAGDLTKEFWVKISTISGVSDQVALVGRLGILSASTLTGLFLLLHSSFGDDVYNPATIIVINLGSNFFFATIYAQILNAGMDTFLISYCYDYSVNDGSKKRPYYTHSSFKKLIAAHTRVDNEYRNLNADYLSGVAGVQQLAREATHRVKTAANEAAQGAEQATKAAAKTAHKIAKVTEETAIAGIKAADKVATTAENIGKQSLKYAEKVGEKGIARVQQFDKNIEGSLARAGSLRQGRRRSMAPPAPRGSRRTTPSRGRALSSHSASSAGTKK